MDAHLHSHAIRHENARRMANAAQRHRLHADVLAPERRRFAGLGLMTLLRVRPLALPAPAAHGGAVVAA